MQLHLWNAAVNASEQFGAAVVGKCFILPYQGKNYYLISMGYQEISDRIVVRMQESSDPESTDQCELIFTQENELSDVIDVIASVKIDITVPQDVVVQQLDDEADGESDIVPVDIIDPEDQPINFHGDH